MISFFKRKILRKIISSELFWKYRHIIQKNFYIENKKQDNKKLLSFVEQNHIESVLDYGCSSGSDLFNLKKKINELFCIGFDVNVQSINYARKIFKNNFKNNFLFIDQFDVNYILKSLNEKKLKNIDFILFDRVLYILEDYQIDYVFDQIFKLKPKFILINDFFCEKSLKYDYTHRNYLKILKKYKYKKLVENKIPQVNFSNAKEYIFYF